MGLDGLVLYNGGWMCFVGQAVQAAGAGVDCHGDAVDRNGCLSGRVTRLEARSKWCCDAEGYVGKDMTSNKEQSVSRSRSEDSLQHIPTYRLPVAHFPHVLPWPI